MPPRAALKKKIKNRPPDIGPNRANVLRAGNLESWTIQGGPFGERKISSIIINANVSPAIYLIGIDALVPTNERQAVWRDFQADYRKRQILWLGATSDSDPTFAFNVSEIQWDPSSNAPRQEVPQAAALAALADIRAIGGTTRWVVMD